MNSGSLIIAGMVGLIGGFAYFYFLWRSTRSYTATKGSVWGLVVAAGVRLALIVGAVIAGLALGVGAAEIAVALAGFILARQISLIRMRRVQAAQDADYRVEVLKDAN